MAERIVTNHEELADAIINMDVDTIYFGADIELEDGITIPAGKERLIFDGEHEGSIHSFTDMSILLPEYTINVDSVSNIEITFRNMTIIGRNYYGIPYISESVDTSGVLVSYQNVTYTGTQLVFNPLGRTHFKDCSITIVPPNAQEVGEVCRVEFEGVNTISHNTTNDITKAVFWFRGETGSAYFRVMNGASLTVDTVNYFMYSTEVISKPVQYQILENASFDVHSHIGFSYTFAHYAESFLVDTGASFRYIQDVSSVLYNSLYVAGDFTVNAGASVYMQADYSDSLSIINFPLFTSGTLRVNNPKSFVLYKPTSAPISMADVTARGFSINTIDQLNHWTVAQPLPDAGDFTDEPQSKWNNLDWSTFDMGGTFSSSSTVAASTGLLDPHTPDNNFSFQSARVISAGNLLLEADPVIDNGRPITGRTEPDAKLIISFTVDGQELVFNDVTADTDGRFELDPEMELPVDTVVYISANTPFLIKKIQTTVLETGEITISSAPVTIAFKAPSISTNPVLLPRYDPETPVKVDDSRQYPTRWQLAVSIEGPLKTASGEVLANAVVFKDDTGTLWDLSSTPLVVRTGEAYKGITDVYWPVDEGILVRVTQSIRSSVEYTTRLIWTLTTIDEP